MQMLCLLFGGLCLILGIVTAGASSEVSSFSIVLGVIFIVCFVLMFFKKFRNTKKVIYKLNGRCLYGLPYGEADCKIEIFEEYIKFTVGKNVADLGLDKVSSILIKDKNELVGSSAGNILIGATLFGALGGIISARPKNKKEYIFIINYDDNGTNKDIAIIFEKMYYSLLMDVDRYINRKIKKNKNSKHIHL